MSNNFVNSIFSLIETQTTNAPTCCANTDGIVENKQLLILFIYFSNNIVISVAIRTSTCSVGMLEPLRTTRIKSHWLIMSFVIEGIGSSVIVSPFSTKLKVYISHTSYFVHLQVLISSRIISSVRLIRGFSLMARLKSSRILDSSPLYHSVRFASFD